MTLSLPPTISPRMETLKPAVHYPSSDGQPMADNTKQFRWIATIEGGLETLLAAHPDVFVAGDLLWYPVEGNDKIRVAPDAMVVFGRPKGDRGAYLQWQEGHIAPQVVFEILSPGNTLTEMAKKLTFYERYGVEEYYIYDPDRNDLSGWQRLRERLVLIDLMDGWTSPRLDIRFKVTPDTLEIYRPDGIAFEIYSDLMARAERETERADREAERADHEAQARRAAEEELLRLREEVARLRGASNS